MRLLYISPVALRRPNQAMLLALCSWPILECQCAPRASLPLVQVIDQCGGRVPPRGRSRCSWAQSSGMKPEDWDKPVIAGAKWQGFFHPHENARQMSPCWSMIGQGPKSEPVHFQVVWTSEMIIQGSLKDTFWPFETWLFPPTKKGNHYLQRNVLVYNVRIPVIHKSILLQTASFCRASVKTRGSWLLIPLGFGFVFECWCFGVYCFLPTFVFRGLPSSFSGCEVALLQVLVV